MKPRVSVVTIFFNAADYLAEAIESVRAQDYADWELLLVDDGSTDESLGIAERYADGERIRILHHPGGANRGATVSRNLGLGGARGELVAFLDADDRWRASKLREQVALLDAMPDVDALFGSVNYWASHSGGVDEIIQSGHVRNRRVPPGEALLKVYPLGTGTAPCPGSDLIARRPLIQSIGGFEESFVGPWFLYEDQAFLMKLYMRGTIYFSDRTWVDYRQHERSCTATGQRDGLNPEARRYCLEWFERYLGENQQRRDVAIRWALFNALRPYRHPHLSRAGRVAKRFFWGDSRASAAAALPAT